MKLEFTYQGPFSDALQPVNITEHKPVSGRFPALPWKFDEGGIMVLDDEKGPGGDITAPASELKKMRMGDYLGRQIHIKPAQALYRFWGAVQRGIEEARDSYKNLHGDEFPLIPARGVTGCYLFVTFGLHGPAFGGESVANYKGADKTDYRRMDIDNLLKAVLDALSGTLFDDDRRVLGIKTVKKPVAAGQASVRIDCLTTKTFKILGVVEAEGEELFHGKWKNAMQVITAQEVKHGSGGGDVLTFVDNALGCIFVSSENMDFKDAIPGYDWKKVEGSVVDGCVVTKRAHREGEEEKTFHWLQKWAW